MSDKLDTRWMNIKLEKDGEYIGSDANNRVGEWKYSSEDGITIKRVKQDEPDKGITQYLITYHGGYIARGIQWVKKERYDKHNL